MSARARTKAPGAPSKWVRLCAKIDPVQSTRASRTNFVQKTRNRCQGEPALTLRARCRPCTVWPRARVAVGPRRRLGQPRRAHQHKLMASIQQLDLHDAPSPKLDDIRAGALAGSPSKPRRPTKPSTPPAAAAPTRRLSLGLIDPGVLRGKASLAAVVEAPQEASPEKPEVDDAPRRRKRVGKKGARAAPHWLSRRPSRRRHQHANAAEIISTTGFVSPSKRPPSSSTTGFVSPSQRPPPSSAPRRRQS